MSGDKKVKIIYIGGIEHSGSTLLGLMLDNHPEVFCGGELTHIARLGWAGQEECSCGKSITNCEFWSQVREIWEQETHSSIGDLIRLETVIDRNMNLPKLFVKQYTYSDSFKKYIDLTNAFFTAIQNVSGKSIIVDTSKRISRAIALSEIEAVDFRLIHLVRDARGVAYSSAKPTRAIKRKWWVSALRWNAINFAFDFAREKRLQQSAILIRYEDLITTPIETLNKIGKVVEVNLSDLANSISQNAPLYPGHIGGGNQFLHNNNQFRIHTEIGWPTKMNARTQHHVWNLTQSGMRRYGYMFQDDIPVQ